MTAGRRIWLLAILLCSPAAFAPDAGAYTVTRVGDSAIQADAGANFIGIPDGEFDEGEFSAFARAQASYLGAGAGANAFIAVQGTASGFDIVLSQLSAGTAAGGGAGALANTGLLNGALDSAPYVIRLDTDTEASGTPFDVTVSAVVDGRLEVDRGSGTFGGSASANAVWEVVADGQLVVQAAAFRNTNGLEEFDDSGSVTFRVADGGTFDLLPLFRGDVSASGNAEFSDLYMTATVAVEIVPVPEPSTALLLAGALVGLGLRQRATRSR